MPYNDPHLFEIIEGVLFTFFAATGGLLAYLLRAVHSNERPKWLTALAEFLASGFVGVLAMLACKAAGFNWMWSGLVVGVFGWLGAETSIMVLRKLVESKLGISTDDNDKGKKNDG